MGIGCEAKNINPILKGHQADIVKWAVEGGRRAIFAAFGLGKTMMQIEICRIIQFKEGGKCLVICPLGVKQEFVRDGKRLNVEFEYIKSNADIDNSKTDFLITNYERVRDCGIDVNKFKVVTLDEASVLRGYGTKTYQEFLKMFPNVKYRFVATATPSPNRYKELIHYAGFLGIMDTGEALTRFFKRDSTKANKLTLYESREKDFWLWLSSWSCFLQKPSDIGYSDEGYSLPPINIHWHEIKINHQEVIVEKDGQIGLFRTSSQSLQSASREKRLTMEDRLNKMKEIIDKNKDDSFILWHHLEDERRGIKKRVPSGVEIYGSLDIEKREKRIIDFSEGREKYLITKPEISGSGCNFQYYCNKCIFVGINYKFNDFIQSIHRIYRFLQSKQVDVYILYAESEIDIKKALEQKWSNHLKLTQNMSELIKKNGLNNKIITERLQRKMGIERKCKKSDLYHAINNDCVDETSQMKSNSVDMICTSIPFGNHYEYSANYNDFGHNIDNTSFFNQMDYLTPNLLKILKPGRVYACHVKDRILFGNATGTGMPTVDPFHAHTIIHTMKHGFQFFGMITIETDVVRENNQTYRLGWTEQCKDGTKMGVGCPEYLLLFRKLPTDTTKAYADNRVEKQKIEYTRGRWQIDARAKWNSSGNRFLTPSELSELHIDVISKIFTEKMNSFIYNYKSHVGHADDLDKIGKLPATFECLKINARTESVWSDINRMATLNTEQSNRNREKHICPLQFDIVDRAIERYTNKSEVVFDPFAGVMTVPYRSIILGRKGIGIELNSEYWECGLSYLEEAEIKAKSPDLFDVIKEEEGVFV